MTNEERQVLAHVVVDPDAWLAHAVSTFGAAAAHAALAAKVERWRGDHAAAAAQPGYKTRAEHEAEKAA